MSSASDNSTASAEGATAAVAGRESIGRFAPSPSGPLHFGSLLAALASFLDVRSRNGRWLLRIDDVDTPRNVAGADSAILKALEAHGLHWDGTPDYQSHNVDAYAAALSTLADQGRLFYCNCARKSLPKDAPYPGTCRHVRLQPDYPHAVRVAVPDTHLEFTDEVQGRQRLDMAETGDFIVYRRDAITSYQLAVVVDDALSGVNRVARGADLLDNTPRQLLLINWLGYEAPAYLHFPTVMNQRQTKLSKQAHAAAVAATNANIATSNLHTALQLLGQPLPDHGVRWRPQELLDWAVAHWQPDQIPNRRDIPGFVAQ